MKKDKRQKSKKNGISEEIPSSFKPSDVADMLDNESADSDNESDVGSNGYHHSNKRQKLDNSEEELSFEESGESSEEDELDDEELEQIELAQRKSSRNEAKVKQSVKELLPIKTKGGLMPRMAIERSEETPQQVSLKRKQQEEIEDSDDQVKVTESKKATDSKQSKTPGKNILSATELLNERAREIELQKFRIGKLCSGITENPEDKIGNLKMLLQFLEEQNADQKRNLLSIRKITMFSLTEIFKDIIPDYKIGIVDLENQKVKKDTLARVTYENELLKYYKKFLKELEHISKALKPGKYSKRPSKESINLAESSIFCLCEILQSHPYFNFNVNIGQLLVIYLNCSNSTCRKMINETFVKIFKTDKRLDLTLHVSFLRFSNFIYIFCRE